MKLSEIFLALASGELSNLHLSNDGQNIRPEKQEQVLRSINLGLNDLHTKFLLRKKLLVIPTVIDQQQYEINDDEFIEIIHINDGNCVLKENHEHGFMLLKPSVFYLNDKPKEVKDLKVLCKVKHRVLVEQDITLDSEVDLPVSYLNALLYFIGSRLFVSIPNQLDGDLNEGMRYQQRYQAEIVSLTNQGVDVDGLDEHNWFNERGFV